MELRNDLIPQIEKIYADKGVDINPEFEHGGVNDNTDPLRDKFNDFRFVYRKNSRELWIMKATTGPGAACILNKEGGAAQLIPGYYPKCHVIDIHAASHPTFAHEAFCQRPEHGCLPLSIWRLDRQGKPQPGIIQTANWFGINVHRASATKEVELIGSYSEGCQVDNDHEDHEQEMDWAKGTSMFCAERWFRWGYMLISSDEIYIPDLIPVGAQS